MKSRALTMLVGSAVAIAVAFGLSGAARTLDVLAADPPAGFDWPQWQGPDRTGLSKDAGLLKQWPPTGPPQVWSVQGIGAGYGSVSLKGDRMFVQGAVRGQSILFSLNRADGRNVWSKTLGPSATNDKGSGPRGTPTVDDDRVYALTENGDLACVKAQDGTLVWQRNILRDFGGRNIGWLLSESPLVDGGNLIVSPGGRGAGMVALDKMSGKTVWVTKELSDEAGYASPIAADVQGVRTIMTLTGEAAVGVRASDGKLMWRYQRVANRTANVATPVFFDNKAFFTSAYGTGAALLALSAQNGEVKADEVYFTRDLQNHHGGVVLVNGYVYGFSNSILTCLEYSTGRTMWRDRSVGKGSLTYADGRLYLLGEDNIVGLAEAVSSGYVERGRFKIPDQGEPSWAHPVVAGGRLYIRNQGTLAAYSVKAG
jgi:outer membrane protein assembly factor BamB